MWADRKQHAKVTGSMNEVSIERNKNSSSEGLNTKCRPLKTAAVKKSRDPSEGKPERGDGHQDKRFWM